MSEPKYIYKPDDDAETNYQLKRGFSASNSLSKSIPSGNPSFPLAHRKKYSPVNMRHIPARLKEIYKFRLSF